MENEFVSRCTPVPGQALPGLEILTGDDGGTGFDLRDFRASTWVLNAMYEKAAERPSTYDERARVDIAAGLREPDMVGDGNLSALTIATGVAMGWTADPGPPFHRLKWADYAARGGAPAVLPGKYPGHGGIRPNSDTGSWPENIRPPGEGSLDWESWVALVHQLIALSGPDCSCFAYYTPWASDLGPFSEEPHIFQGRLGDALQLVLNPNWQSSPQNFWPLDKTWFVYTDYDGWGTRVSGSSELITRLRADPFLECVSLDNNL